MQKALFIIITDNPGGAERVANALASELAKWPFWKVEVIVVCSSLPHSFTARTLDPRVRVRYGLLRNWYLAFLFLPFRILFKNYDVVFGTHIYVNTLLSLFRRLGLFRTNRLILRESITVFDRFSGIKPRLFQRLYQWYGAEDLLIAQTGYMAEHVRPWLPAASASRLQVFPNPVDVEAIERAAREPLEPDLQRRLSGRRNVLFCGRLVPFKRPGAAVEAFRLACIDMPDAQLVIMGGGQLEAAVRKQVSDLELTTKVLILGQRSNPYPIMTACQYGLLTSANEGFPNVVLEMMAAGMRTITVTPCAGDLDSLPGVEVSRTHDVIDIANTLREALRSGSDRSGVYKRAASARSVSGYLTRAMEHLVSPSGCSGNAGDCL